MAKELVTVQVIVNTDEGEGWEEAEAWAEWVFDQPTGKFQVVGVKWEGTLEDVFY